MCKISIQSGDGKSITNQLQDLKYSERGSKLTKNGNRQHLTNFI